MTNFRLKISHTLAFSGLFCFIASLALPSIRVSALNTPADFSGAQAMFWAILESAATLANFHVNQITEFAKAVGLGAAGLCNIALVTTPLLLRFRIPRRSLFRHAAVVSLLGLILGMLAPYFASDSKPAVLAGYFLWLLGFGLQFIAAIIAWKQIGKEQ